MPTYLYAGYTNGYTHMELHSGKWPWTASFGHIDEWATQFWLIVFSNYSLSRAISVNDLEAKFGHISYWFYIHIKRPVIKRRSEHGCPFKSSNRPKHFSANQHRASPFSQTALKFPILNAVLYVWQPTAD